MDFQSFAHLLPASRRQAAKRCAPAYHSRPLLSGIRTSRYPSLPHLLLAAFLLAHCSPTSVGLLSAQAQGTYIPYKATQAEVNAGLNIQKYVAPDTLKNWSTNSLIFAIATNGVVVGYAYYPLTIGTNGVVVGTL